MDKMLRVGLDTYWAKDSGSGPQTSKHCTVRVGLPEPPCAPAMGWSRFSAARVSIHAAAALGL